MNGFLKNKIIIDTGALLEYFKLLLDSIHKKLDGQKRNQLIRFNEFFKGRELFIVPQVLAEFYSLLKRDAKDSISKISHWLKLPEDPYLRLIMEKYIPKEEILKEKKYLEFGFTDIALMKALNKENFLLTTDFELFNLCKHRGLEAHHIVEII